MKAEQVDQALHQKFVTEDARLVFWHDANAEFADYIDVGLSGDLAHVQILDVEKMGGLSAKLRLEREDPTGKYLVYSKGTMPPAEEDWLLDIRLYSAQFHADVASLWLQELGLKSLSLRDHLRARATFMGSQGRRKKLSRLTNTKDDEAALDLKMMAVLVGSPVATPFEVLRALCHGHVQNTHFDLSQSPDIMATIEKMSLLDRFWELMRIEFSYTSDTPSIAGLLRKLFVSELIHQTDGTPIEALAHHQLPTQAGRNAVVFLTQWRDSSGTSQSYDATANAIAAEQNINDHLSNLDLETIKDVYTFWEAERRVVSNLKDWVLAEAHTVDVGFVSALANDRKAGHWLSGPGSNHPERVAITRAYDAIVAAAELFALRQAHQHNLTFDTPQALFTAYQTTLYRFDQLYRHFCTHAKPAQGQGWDLLKTLTDEVERVYDQGFLQPLGIKWSQLLDQDFLSTWSLDTMPPQQNFYAKNIRPHLAESDRKRAFVIISDAFRYEAARELTASLNGKYRMNAKISAMLGVLPSYTALGMASLLPHTTLSYNNKGDVLVDDKPIAGTEARNKQLATVQGMACQAKDLLSLKQADARNFTQDQKVVYIYHNVIDNRGDTAATEGETFEAVSDCIDELVELVQFCVNKLNAAKVWVTADHGFLFQQETPNETDKSKLSHKPDNAVIAKKRYIIGSQMGTTPEAHHGSLKITANVDGDMDFWVPRATNRFHFTGGARYLHGGAMPQEVVVPLITVTHIRGKEKEASRSEKVSIQVLGTNHKITTPTYRFELIQTEAVGERRKPITLRAAVYDGADAVTSIETITFDSTSDRIDERKKSLRFELRTGTFDKNTPYKLILRDIESDAEVQSVPVIIDRSFEDDF